MNDCIIHSGSYFIDKSGKPRARIGGRHAARVLWERKFGPIAKGLYVCHKCDDGMCVNLDHIFIGTQKDNMQDAVKKGRPVGRIPREHPQLAEMLRLKGEGFNNTQIGRQLGLDHSTIRHHLRK
jgi:hypothetical protein